MGIIGQLIRYRAGVGSAETVESADKIDDALGYADKVGDREILEDFTLSRYATGIKRATPSADVTDSTGAVVANGYDTYTIGDKAAAITLGNKYEIVPSGLYSRIVEETATLFTHSKQSWKFISDTGDEIEDFGETITAHRDAGSFGDAVVRWDRMSVAVGSAALWLKWVAGHIHYEALRPTDVRLMFPTEISDGGEDEQSRGPIYTEIEDCLAVGIRLRQTGAMGSTSSLWIAYVGRCDAYPGGRCVTYEARNWWPLPDVGDTSIVDEWLDSAGEIGNPLTALQDDEPGLVQYEFPIVPIYGSDSGTDKRVLPTSPSLFERCLELDSAGSRVLTSANKAAAGIIAVRDPDNAGLPSTIEGYVALRGGQEISSVGPPASNAKDAGVVIDGKAREIAESEGVPGYTVLAGGKAPESAAALMIRHQPQMDRRARRIKLNHGAVEKLVAVERYLLALHGDVALQSVDVQWDPGEWKPPVPSAMQVEELKAAKEANLIDHVESVRRYHGFDTREQARKYLDEIKEDAAVYGTGVPSVDRAVRALAPRPAPLINKTDE